MLFIILLAGFILKLLYLFVIGPPIFGFRLLITEDSFSYADSFINLVNSGQYTHNLNYEPASYGRLPGLSYLWGIFYLLFGNDNAYLAFALFQILLDVLAVIMVFKIMTKFFNERTGWTVSALYALFPLTCYFIVKTDTEYLSLFLVITVFYQLVFFKPGVKNSLLLGFLLMYGFYVREVLALLTPLSFFYLWRNYDLKLKHYAIVALVMLILYIPWPIRNYVRSGELILIKPLSAGYLEYNEDMLSYMYWLYAWSDDNIDRYLAYTFSFSKEVVFPEEVFNSEAEKKLAHDCIILGRKCASSFVTWQRIESHEKCLGKYDGLISRSFDLLQKNYRVNHPFNYYVKVPLRNLSKAFFKTSLNHSGNVPTSLFTMIMLFRSFLLFLGIFACFYFRKIDYFKISFFFFIIIYIFICGILRQVEMRYLYQADIIMLICAAAFLANKFFGNKRSVT
jgi:hypothetical protein